MGSLGQRLTRLEQRASETRSTEEEPLSADELAERIERLRAASDPDSRERLRRVEAVLDRARERRQRALGMVK